MALGPDDLPFSIAPFSSKMTPTPRFLRVPSRPTGVSQVCRFCLLPSFAPLKEAVDLEKQEGSNRPARALSSRAPSTRRPRKQGREPRPSPLPSLKQSRLLLTSFPFSSDTRKGAASTGLPQPCL